MTRSIARRALNTLHRLDAADSTLGVIEPPAGFRKGGLAYARRSKIAQPAGSIKAELASDALGRRLISVESRRCRCDVPNVGYLQSTGKSRQS